MSSIRSKTLSGRKARKSHTKSRQGCANCKRRHIKCDESQPACGHCVQHSVQCQYARNQNPLTPSSTSASPSQQVSGPSEATSPSAPERTRGASHLDSSSSSAAFPYQAISATGLNVADLELLHNYTTSTCYTFSKDPNLHTFFRTKVPEIGFSSPLVLHSLLAISALQLARFRTASARHYRALAYAHHDAALRLGNAELAALTEDNGPNLFLFANLCSGFTLGAGPQPGDFMLFGSSGPAEWFVLFRGVRAIIESQTDALMHGPLAPLFTISMRKLLPADRPAPEIEQLRVLQTQIASELGPHDPHLSTYTDAVDSLSRSWPTADMGSSPQTMGVWLYRVSDAFVEQLQNQEPIPLVIFAYFCVLLDELGTSWWTTGWTNHLMQGIYDRLDENWRLWIRWPMQRIGWLPDRT